MQWIKLTSPQAAELAALSESNPTSNFVSPLIDVDGAQWIGADCLTEVSGVFAHYAPLLSTLAPTAEEPIFS